ncbi:MAG: rhodanese-like domain-containing protein [Rhodospirillales bacterium]|nr:rhodanese-like domain-containing protein [Rhodospirillales bacterium]
MSTWFSRFFARSPAAGPPGLARVDAATLRAWLEEGDVLLVDIREAGEYARGSLPRSLSVPLSRFPERLAVPASARRVVFYCQSGQRTRFAAGRLVRSTSLPAFMLEGGLGRWRG